MSLTQMNLDIILLQEVSHSKYNKNSKIIKAQGYNIISTPRDEGIQGGGTAVMYRSNLQGLIRADVIPFKSEGIEATIVHFQADAGFLYVASVYIPQPGNRSFLTSLPSLLAKVADAPCLFCGDFNLHHPAWNAACNEPFDYAEAFLSMVSSQRFVLNNVPNIYTRYSNRDKAVLDLTFTRELTIDNWDAVATPDSDHHIITFALSLPHGEGQEHNRQKQVDRVKYFRWKRAEWAKYQQYIEEHLPEPPCGRSSQAPPHRTVHESSAIFEDILRQAVRAACPCGSLRHKANEWPDELARLHEETTQAKIRYIRTETDADRDAFDRLNQVRRTAIAEFLDKKYQKRINSLQPGEALDWKMLKHCLTPSTATINQIALRG
ncbi:hypothetical protein STCU_02809, partial [Strigomonas culicis]